MASFHSDQFGEFDIENNGMDGQGRPFYFVLFFYILFFALKQFLVVAASTSIFRFCRLLARRTEEIVDPLRAQRLGGQRTVLLNIPAIGSVGIVIQTRAKSNTLRFDRLYGNVWLEPHHEM